MPTILAIDDKPDNLLSLSALLKSMIPGCRVLTALSGHQGIEKAKTENPDTILLDIHMPEMNGFEACRILKFDPGTKHIPVIMLTAVHTGSDSRVKGLELGADAFLTKPVDQFELTAQIKAMLRIKYAEDVMRQESETLEQQVAERTSELVKNRDQLISEIEERRLTENALGKSEEKYRTLTSNIPGMIYRAGSDWSSEILSNSEVLCDYSPEEFKSQKINWLDLIHPDDKERVSEECSKIIDEPSSITQEYRIFSKGGITRWVSDHKNSIFDKDGFFKGVDGIIFDIDEQKQAKEKLSLQSEIITRMTQGVSLVGEDGIIIYTNPEFERMFGYNSGEMVGLHTSVLNAPTEKNPEETATEIFNILNTKGAWSGEIQNIKKNGISFWSAANVTAMEHLKYGKAFVSVHTDISELKQTKSEKKKLEAKLQQSQKMESIGNLAGGIAHDFNNLLYPIIGFAEMLKEDLPPDSPEYDSAQEIFNAGRRGGELVKQILAFSRQTEHKLLPVRFQKVLTEVCKLTRSTIPSDIKIHLDIQKDCGLVMAESTQLHQVAMNLITNAYHAVEKASGEISIQLKEIMLDNDDLKDSHLQSGQYVILSVSDNGVGIPREVMNNIFEPYFTTKEKGKGTGLGLAVVYGILTEHKGDINVYSEEGKGTTFNVYLPLMKKSTESISNEKESNKLTGTERILLVDDEESVVRLEKQMLERLGYNVSAISDSLEALETFKSNPDSYDLVISDMTMPNMTGDLLAQELMSIRPDIPIIICTGFSERINKEQAEANKVKGFLMKPVVKSEMAQMVRKVLDEATVYKRKLR